MKITISSGISFVAICSIVALSGCGKEEDRLTVSDTKDVTEEAQIDFYYQDMDDLAAVAIDAPSDNEYSGGRTDGAITIEDQRFNCDGVVVTIEPGVNSTIEVPYGVLTVDFGTAGCTDLRGNVRKGKLIFTYNGWRYQSGSSVIMTTDNYFINGIKLEGTRTSTNITANENDPPKFNVVLTDGKATFPDNSVAERESDITWSWMRGASPALDKVIIHSNSSAGGITRAGHSYDVSLLEQLQYNRFCGIAVSGIKKYLIDGEKEITIDYGDGECDTTVTVTVNGITRVIVIG
jgi:hypothetical protein